MKGQNYDTVVEDCIGDNVRWTDPLFGPSKTSLCHADMWAEKQGTYGDFDWLRATKIPSLTDDDGDLSLFVDDPHPNDI